MADGRSTRMAAPLVGISAPRNPEKSAFGLKDSILQVFEYSNAVVKAGGRPVLLPPTDELPEGDLLDGFSGLVLSGGGDISPKHYGGEDDPNNYGISEFRDNHEIALINEAKEKNIPILAICRGLQFINVLHGGTLHSHIDGHWQEDDPTTPLHTIDIVEDSKLHSLIGKKQISVNSFHHQAIDKLGEGLKAVAYSGNIIEAIEDESGLILGVQWHPEHLYSSTEENFALFKDLMHRIENTERNTK